MKIFCIMLTICLLSGCATKPAAATYTPREMTLLIFMTNGQTEMVIRKPVSTRAACEQWITRLQNDSEISEMARKTGARISYHCIPKEIAK